MKKKEDSFVRNINRTRIIYRVALIADVKICILLRSSEKKILYHLKEIILHGCTTLERWCLPNFLFLEVRMLLWPRYTLAGLDPDLFECSKLPSRVLTNPKVQKDSLTLQGIWKERTEENI